MKKLVTLFLLLFTIVAFSQKKFEGKATYMSKRTVDMSQFGEFSEQQKKQWMERMKSFLEKTYTLSFNQSESSFKEDVKLEAPGTSGPGWAGCGRRCTGRSCSTPSAPGLCGKLHRYFPRSRTAFVPARCRHPADS